MLFERVYDGDLAHASFVIGCQKSSEAVVVDARRDIGVYLRLAEENGMEVVGVTETHIHADYLSGSRELAAATGARLYLSGEGGEGWQYEFEGERLMDGDEIRIGNIRLKALHTPGHTPEHLSFLVTDGGQTDEPGYLLSGDFVFVGDLGRPDLLDEAAGSEDTRFAGASQMYRSLREKFLPLPDYVQVHPGHGAGSACGKSLGAVPSSTVGYERLFSWWGRYLESGDEEGFVKELLSGQPDAPAYFGRMKRQNRGGPEVLGRPSPLREYDPSEVEAGMESGGLILVDTRPVGSVHRGTVPGALDVPYGKNFASWAAWAIDPEVDGREIVLLATDAADASEMRNRLLWVGIDRVVGYVTGFEGLEEAVPRLLPPEDLDAPGGSAFVLDVRTKGEYEAGNIPGSEHIQGGRVLWNLDALPRDGRIVTYCGSGARSSVVASVLRANGFDVSELDGTYGSWASRQRRSVGASA
ncbi:MBL fold metallo-hydrolase [Rubrobacter indicoceani]|uniref:MBL fold metallo-hydrolase n=1 Tax=Rubrobacter indicoceani TaxID=2051957 RepID=UPI000E5BCDF6|nr:MBL fold metallo-hydrolase [Rubrobacter indicoceani]